MLGINCLYMYGIYSVSRKQYNYNSSIQSRSQNNLFVQTPSTTPRKYLVDASEMRARGSKFFPLNAFFVIKDEYFYAR